MHPTLRRSLVALLALSALGTLAQDSSAGSGQGFLNKPMWIIVPTSDLTARFMADALGRELRTAVVVENRTGSNGIVAMTALPLIAGGKLKMLEVTDSHRSTALPKVPTLEESVVARAEITSRQALVAHAGIPDAVAARLTSVLTRILATPEYAKLLAVHGIEKELVAPGAYSKSGPEELRKWTEMVTLSGAKFD